MLLVGNFLYATVGTRGVCEELEIKLRSAGWRVLTTSCRPGRASRLVDMLGTVWRRRREYAVAQVDVFSGAAFIWAEAVCSALRVAGKPYVLVLHGGNLPAFARGRERRVRRLFGSAAAVLTPSAYLREQMSAYRHDLMLLPNPLDVGAYTFRLRRLPEPSLVWLRAFHQIYNPRLAPRALKLLLPEFPNARLTMLGPDKGDGSLQAVQREARELGVEDRLCLPGRIPKDEVPRWLNEGDVFLNTTDVDNTPVSVLEAMACGLCIVSTAVGGIPHLVRDGHEALLVPPGDPAAVAAAVRRVLTEPHLAASLSRNAREKAEGFDWSTILPRWEALLTTIAGSGHRRELGGSGSSGPVAAGPVPVPSVAALHSPEVAGERGDRLRIDRRR